jgi:hypothetical protein
MAAKIMAGQTLEMGTGGLRPSMFTPIPSTKMPPVAEMQLSTDSVM